MKDLDYHDMPQPLGMYAGDLYRRAIQYLKAAEALSPDDPDLGFPAQFLLAHGVELMLKSYLASQGESKPKIKSYNHRLSDLHDECTARGLSVEWKFKALIEQIAIMNSSHDFRYPSGYITMMPTINHCMEIVNIFQAALHPIISREEISSNLDWAANTRHLRGKKKVRWSD